MTPQSVIRLKRDGGELPEAAIKEFVSGAVDGSWSRGQIGAMLMALFQKGLSLEETRVLLEQMLHSGEVLDMEGIDTPVADKHSTGGVGDKISLVLAPLAAACGLAVPMLSGRGLGHTGGTLDKLESIPGFKVFLNSRELRKQVETIGCVIAGQTESIVPADKILYAMRDETSTVEHPSLVAASILSKKLAEGLDALLLDVKFGRGAFFEKFEDAEFLAQLMVDLGKAAGCRVGAWLTCMDAPLGRAVGNAVEVEECISIMKGEGPDQLADFICELVAGMLFLAGKDSSLESALEHARARLADGSALDRFRSMVAMQGGDVAIIESPEKLPQARVIHEVLYEESKPAWVRDVDARKVAEIVLETGAGRRNADDDIQHGSGISGLVCIGERIEPGDLLARIHAENSEQLEAWSTQLASAVSFSDEPVEPASLIIKQIM
ncbi:thymidine phosphorylase [Puniceicoccales bacterium CK1056]|uniref:thymidine phosphorylase n=1 Tax=Oceanipulchritudo coccoides TaxID=2706888 RepID=A0A6B2LXQ3_9BACT|nr:thymidine phosphorylase [Oceanipulchritudo coccoides]NDV60872.1 thymidine phosphorylase [Oceanipulchritudo coccoides]